MEKKKITLAEKAKAKEDEINQLLLELSNKKPKFKKISSDISVGSGLASEFAEKCCPQKTGTGKKQTVTANADSKFKRVCEQLEKDFPDETKPAKAVKQKKAS